MIEEDIFVDSPVSGATKKIYIPRGTLVQFVEQVQLHDWRNDGRKIDCVVLRDVLLGWEYKPVPLAELLRSADIALQVPAQNQCRSSRVRSATPSTRVASLAGLKDAYVATTPDIDERRDRLRQLGRPCRLVNELPLPYTELLAKGDEFLYLGEVTRGFCQIKLATSGAVAIVPESDLLLAIEP